MRRPQRYFWLLPFVILGLLMFFSNRIAVLYTDWLWHRDLGTEIVFQRIVSARVFLLVVFGLASFLFAYFNVWLADRISPPSDVPIPGTHKSLTVFTTNQRPVKRWLQALTTFRHVLDVSLLVGAFLFAVFAGLRAQAEWNEFLRFAYPVSFGERDPQFGRDIGFYVFHLPFLLFIQGWLFNVIFLVALGVTVVYLYQQGINRVAGIMTFLPHVRRHLSVLLALLLATAAWGYWLNRYALLFQQGDFPGAGYADIYARLPLLNLLAGFAFVGALLCLGNLHWRTIVLPGVIVALWGILVLISVVVPQLVYQIQIMPSETALEEIYLRRAIQGTRQGYNLHRMRTKHRHLSAAPTDLTTPEKTTILQNLVYRDPEVRLQELNQRAQQRYYRFPVVAHHLYSASGRTKIALVAPRVMNREAIDPRAMMWSNLHLRYTHGIGMNVTTADGDGTRLLMSGVPPRTDLPNSEFPKELRALRLQEPRSYLDTRVGLDDYIIVGARNSEFDYVRDSGEIVESRYQGKTGIPLNWVNRLAFALRFASPSILLSQELTPKSRLLFYLRINARLKKILPFLLLDNTPYPVIAGGRILYVQQGYTTTSTYPYSRTRRGQDGLSPEVDLNYVRPAVTATVDSYDGQVRLYITDPDDPLIQMYQRSFPGLFLPYEQMPGEVRQRLQYPKDLFLWQRHILTEYHVENATALYDRSSVLQVPPKTADLQQTTPRQDTTPNFQREMSPVYGFVAKTTTSPALSLYSVYTPAEGERLAALLEGEMGQASARSPRYQLSVSYLTETEKLPGPVAASRQIRSDSTVARFRSETALRGGRVQFGEVLPVVLPDTLLYVQPLYVQADRLPETLPELLRVAVVAGDRVVLATDMREAVSKLTVSRPDTATSPAMADALAQALEIYERGQIALRRGDFAAYGKENAALGTILRRIQQKGVKTP